MADNTKAAQIAAAGAYPTDFGARERKLLELSATYVPASSGNWGSSVPTTLDGALDTLASGTNGAKMVKAVWDFSVNGGAVGDIALSVTVPSGGLVTRTGYYVNTTCTSGGAATVALKLGAQASGTIVGGTPIAVATLTAGAVANGDVTDVATAKRASADRILTLVVGTAALTAGKITFVVEYIVV